MSDYALGHTPKEYARLTRQAELLEPLTRRLYAEAGIGQGMRVLEFGCGAGDITLLLSEIVGPQGSVVGVDMDAEVVAHARERAATAGRTNVEFLAANLSALPSLFPAGSMDAVVGRLVLMYVPDPAAALASVLPALKPGGIVAFQEPWFQASNAPDSYIKRTSACIIETLRQTGAHIDLGPRLHRIFAKAGLPLPKMRWEAVMEGGPDSPHYQYFADTLESTLPRAIELGIAKEGDFDLATLAGKIRDEMEFVGYAMPIAPLVSAWCRLPG